MSIAAGAYLFFLSIIFSLLADRFGYNIYPDSNWYVVSGNSLWNLQISIEYLLFSPLHSLMTAFSDSIQDRIDQSLLAGFNYLAQSIYCIFMGICVFQFSSLLATCRILSSKSSKLFCLVILTNPYVVRYSTGIYPEYYALLGCLLIASRLLLLNCFKLRLNAH